MTIPAMPLRIPIRIDRPAPDKEGGGPRRLAGALALSLAGWLASVPADAVDLAGVSKVGVGVEFTCVLTTSGAVQCWGRNWAGQIGDNTTIQRRTPVTVSGLGSGATDISVGSDHACAVTATGGVKCWGFNGTYQLGDRLGNRSVPVDVPGLTSGVAAITAGSSHTCALTTLGGVKCWGATILLGGDPPTTGAPVDVSGLTSGVAAITAGGSHTCALTTLGGVKCWGSNAYGQLGDNSTIPRYSPTTPVDVSGLTSGVAAIAAGYSHTCALTTGGGLKCWGGNWAGQIGDNSTTDRLAPVEVTGLTTGVAAIVAGGNDTCARTLAGGMKCWGDNRFGQMGNNTSGGNQPTPADVPGLAVGVAAMATGPHACAVNAQGGVKCWGLNTYGQLGDNTFSGSFSPKDVAGLAGPVSAIAAGAYRTCALTTAGGVKCWGENGNGGIGDNTTIDRPLPTDVLGLSSGVAAIASGGHHACALTTAGAVKCWGLNTYGQLGDGSTVARMAPVDVSGLGGGVAAITAGASHTCALTTTGGVKCWGENNSGQLGNDSIVEWRVTPVDVSGLGGGVAAIVAGGHHTCALTALGGVKCWGSNGFGQLGDSSVTQRRTPVDVTGLAGGVASLAAGFYHTCARTVAGAAKCWGYNDQGQLGDGTLSMPLSFRAAPADVTGLASGVTAIAANHDHSCALTTGGAVKCWGNNANGQLGDNSQTRRTAPVDVIGLGGGAAAIAPGYFHTCALVAGGGVKCWGYNLLGELGNGSTGFRPVPASVVSSGGCDVLAAGDCDNDGIPNLVESIEGTDSLVKDNDVFSPGSASARLFAMQQYRDFLNGEGDPGGIQGWTDLVVAGTYSRLQVIDAFLQSQEFSGFVSPVVRLYFATFLRAPDYGGLAFNAGLVRNGTVTLTQLADFFAGSPEFVALYGALDNAQFVTLLYSNVLGRAPDTGGFNGWVSLLNGGMSRGQVLLGFSDSAEYQAAMANEVFVTMMYAGMLRRTPEQAGFDGWLGFLDAGTYTRQQVINGFFLSAEYRGRFLP